MATKQAVVPVSYAAGADLRTKQFRAVKMSGNRAVTVVSGANDNMIGVLQNTPNEGQAAEIDISGITKWEAGATITAGQRVKKHTDGTCLPVGVGVAYDGVAVRGAASAEYAEVLLVLGGYGV